MKVSTNYSNIKFVYILAVIFGSVLCLFPSNKAEALSVSARIADQSVEVSGGDRLYFEVEIKYPENIRRKDLRVEYQVLENGEVIATEKVLRAVETQASFLDYIVVPQSAKGGIHELDVVIADYEDLHAEVSASFKIIKGLDQALIYFFILLLAILLVGILVALQIRVITLKNKQS